MSKTKKTEKGAIMYVCEDYPCCGHEAGDCDGSKYGSDEDIKQAVYDRMNDDYYSDHPREGEE